MKTTTCADGNQVLTHAGECLYRSKASGVYYAIYKRAGKQIRRSLKTTDKELARRRAAKLREKVARLNTKEGAEITFPDLAARWLGAVSSTLKPSSRLRRWTAIHSLTRFLKGVTVRPITNSHVEQ